MTFVKVLAILIAGLFGLAVLAILGVLAVDLMAQHPQLAIPAILLVGLLVSGLGRWRATAFQLQRPWLRPGTNDSARRYQERWETEQARGRLRGGREEDWRA